MSEGPQVYIVDIFPPWNAECTCCVCGVKTVNQWAVPVDSGTALICSNDFEGDWGAKPACEACWKIHDEGGLVGHEPKY